MMYFLVTPIRAKLYRRLTVAVIQWPVMRKFMRLVFPPSLFFVALTTAYARDDIRPIARPHFRNERADLSALLYERHINRVDLTSASGQNLRYVVNRLIFDKQIESREKFVLRPPQYYPMTWMLAGSKIETNTYRSSVRDIVLQYDESKNKFETSITGAECPKCDMNVIKVSIERIRRDIKSLNDSLGRANTASAVQVNYAEIPALDVGGLVGAGYGIDGINSGYTGSVDPTRLERMGLRLVNFNSNEERVASINANADYDMRQKITAAAIVTALGTCPKANIGQAPSRRFIGGDEKDSDATPILPLEPYPIDPRIQTLRELGKKLQSVYNPSTKAPKLN